MKDKIYVGVDAGLQGAFAIFGKNGELLDLVDMPIKRIGYNKSLNRSKLYSLIGNLFKKYTPHFFLEYPTFSTRETQPNTAYKANIYGINLGLVEGFILAHAYNSNANNSITRVNVISWKSYYQLIGKDKVDSCIVASNLYKSFHDKIITSIGERIKYMDGRAEAILIGNFALKNKHKKL